VAVGERQGLQKSVVRPLVYFWVGLNSLSFGLPYDGGVDADDALFFVCGEKIAPVEPGRIKDGVGRTSDSALEQDPAVAADRNP
jgi:hypothetical protein